MQLLSTIKAQWTSKIRSYLYGSFLNFALKNYQYVLGGMLSEYRVRGAVAFCSNEINPITNPVILVWQTMFSQDCLYLVSFNVLTVFVFFYLFPSFARAAGEEIHGPCAFELIDFGFELFSQQTQREVVPASRFVVCCSAMSD